MQQKILQILAIALFCIGLAGCKTSFLRDIEGTKYKTVTIGTQVWMAENLKTTKFNDGTPIPMISDNEAWSKLEAPAFSWYNNDSTENKNTYGALYNWYTVSTNKLCPAGWHVPADEDWMTLTSYLDGFKSAGGKLKEKGTLHWRSPNTEASDEIGFSALPGGYRSFKGVFNYIGISGYWWSSTEYNESSILFWNLRYKISYIFRYRSEKYCGFSVRCLRDH